MNMSEFYDTEKALQKLTETNLKNEFQNVHDFSESAIHFANRCDMSLSLKDLVFAELASSALRNAAEQRYINGTINRGELTGIIDKSIGLIADELVEEVTKALIASCDCRKA